MIMIMMTIAASNLPIPVGNLHCVLRARAILATCLAQTAKERTVSHLPMLRLVISATPARIKPSVADTDMSDTLYFVRAEQGLGVVFAGHWLAETSKAAIVIAKMEMDTNPHSKLASKDCAWSARKSKADVSNAMNG